MDEINKPVDQPKPKPVPTKNKKHLGLIIFHIIAISVIISGSIEATYLWRNSIAQKTIADKDALILSMSKTIAASLTPTTTPAGTPSPADCDATAPSATVIDNIKASITSGNTQALEGYMAASVNTVLAATEAYGPQTPTQSVASITTFIGSPVTTTWNFNLGASVISSYGQGGYEQYFPSIAVVGKSNTDTVISFGFDCDGKINTVFMAGSESLLQ